MYSYDREYYSLLSTTFYSEKETMILPVLDGNSDHVEQKALSAAHSINCHRFSRCISNLPPIFDFNHHRATQSVESGVLRLTFEDYHAKDKTTASMSLIILSSD